MRERRIVIYAFIFYVMLTSLHRILDYTLPPTNVDWFIIVDKFQDVQWYVKDTFDLIGFSVILLALHRISSKSLRFTTGIFLANSIIQVPLYYICYLRYDIIVNFTIIVVILLKIRYDEKRINNR